MKRSDEKNQAIESGTSSSSLPIRSTLPCRVAEEQVDFSTFFEATMSAVDSVVEETSSSTCQNFDGLLNQTNDFFVKLDLIFETVF